jgi:arsenite/tail-anchored protein-transporting ATPase
VLLDRIEVGPRWTLVGGKGGVGKTTVAAALALALAERGEPILVLSVDPAHSLGDALEVALGPEPRAVPGAPNLAAMEVDADRERTAFLERYRDELATLFVRGTFLTPEEVEAWLGLPVPGMDEMAAMLRLMELSREGRYARVVVDTAPTGHTLRLLAAPELVRGWVGLLGALDARHRAVEQAFAPVPRPADPAHRFLDALDADLGRLAACLSDPGHTRFLLVTTPEPVVLAETGRLRESLLDAGVALGGVVVNRTGGEADAALRGLWEERRVPIVFLPLLHQDPRGVDGLRRFAAHACPAPATTPPSPTAADPGAGAGVRTGGRYRPPTDRRLYLVGGKGGVGKTTVASALALALADAGRAPVLLLSTDPAGSLSDVWDTPVGDAASAAPGAAGVALRQLDASAEWSAFRAAYRQETERLFAGLLGSSLSAGADRRVAERLLGVAPPGVDELMALLQTVDVLDLPAYNALVVDTAPTGHLLRLLEMPRLALDWAHAILRLLLRYREAVGLGGIAERVLRFARDVRRLRELLQDARSTWVGVVALPEALSVPETARLLQRLRTLRMDADVLLVNRLFEAGGEVPPSRSRAAGALLRPQRAEIRAGAPAWEAGPRGAGELRRFAAAWRQLEVD